MKIKSEKTNYVKKSTCSVSTQTRRRRGNISEAGAKIDRGIPFWGTLAKTNKIFVVLNFEKQKPNSTLRSETNKTERKYFRSGNKNRSRNSFLGKLLRKCTFYKLTKYLWNPARGSKKFGFLFLAKDDLVTESLLILEHNTSHWLSEMLGTKKD